MNANQSFVLIVLPVAFVGLWIGMLYVLYILSGWKKLETIYKEQSRFKGLIRSFQSGSMNRVRFSNSLKVGVDDIGLYLAPIFPFRLFHDPLYIPWDRISHEEVQKYVFKYRRLTFQEVADVRLDMPKRTFKNLEPYLIGPKSGR